MVHAHVRHRVRRDAKRHLVAERSKAACRAYRAARLLIDRSFTEIFLDGGAVCATHCFEALGDDVTLRIASDAVSDMHIYRMRPCNITKA